MKKNIFILIIFTFFLCFNKTYALQVGQTLEDGQIIDEINTMDIIIKNKLTNIENFLSNKWRTYVKLNDLCSDEIDVCKIEKLNSEEIILTKNYENMDNVYYKTAYIYKDNTYKSLLKAPNSLDFSFGDIKTSPDVKPINIDGDLYVPIRFISEALGAEVIYENKTENEKASIKIDFYSNMNFDFNFEFFDISTLEGTNYSAMEKYDFKDLKKNSCYDIVVNVNDTPIYNSKLFTQNENFIKIDYNNNVQTNICLHDDPTDKSISFVFNYNNVPLIYNVDESIIETKELDKIYLTGDVSNISKENEVSLNVNYEGNKTNFQKFATLKWQGSSSLVYDKKNYTIKLYDDDQHKNKYKISINNWDKRNKYVLKANYVDYTQARNIVSAKLWGQVVRSRKNVNTRLTNLVNGGAIDGYPVLLYINDEYQGLYTFNTAKDEDLFNMDVGNVLIESDSYKDDSLFKTRIDFNDSNTGWEIIYSGGKNDDEIEESINQLVEFTINNDGNDFKNNIEKYMDVDSAIDYLIYMYYICAADNTAKNMLWVSFNNKVWFPSVYDLDSTFSNGEENFNFYSYDTMLPSFNEDGSIKSNTPNGMLLWTKLLNTYRKEIKERYNELRKDILNSNNVIRLFKNFKRQIPNNVYNENLNRWPNLPNSMNDNYNQIYNFIKDREKLMDEIINKF